jgi:hypothetical protein
MIDDLATGSRVCSTLGTQLVDYSNGKCISSVTEELAVCWDEFIGTGGLETARGRSLSNLTKSNYILVIAIVSYSRRGIPFMNYELSK